jgi:phage terminase large subunit GpA-like protein
MMLIQGMLDGLRPPPRLLPTEWADQHRYLSSKASAEPGRWRTSRTPYLAEIMDNFAPYSPVQEVVFMKGAQIGATEVLYNIMGFYIDIDPCPILAVMPTEGTAKKNTKLRFQPMVDASPTLLKKVGVGKSRKASNTLQQKDFPGGAIVFGGANSAASLRSLPIRVLLLDELDAYPSDLDGEGSPVELAKARTSTFANKKVAYVSTPTDEDNSLIEAYFKASDQRYYHVPCPHCGTMQALEPENLVYDSSQKMIQEAHYQCAGCDELIEERYKTKMLALGEWVVTNPVMASKLRRGYHLNSLYSPYGWKSWREIAQQIVDAERENSDEKRKVVVNTVFGRTVKNKSITPKPQVLFDRAGGYRRGEVPEEVAMLTCGVDVQKDRLELEIVGWGDRRQSWSIDYIEIPGETDQPQVWDNLTRILYRTWTRKDGVELGLSKMAVDSGYNTQHVYNWCRLHPMSLVIAVKGSSNTRQTSILRKGTAVDVDNTGRKIDDVSFWNLGVDMLKAEVYGHLNAELNPDASKPMGWCFFPGGYALEYYRMLCAEKRVLQKDNKGYTRWYWQKIRPRNEAFDCRVYARAAAHLAGVDRWNARDWESERRNGYVPPKPANLEKLMMTPIVEHAPEPLVRTPKPPRKRRKSSFWEK